MPIGRRVVQRRVAVDVSVREQSALRRGARQRQPIGSRRACGRERGLGCRGEGRAGAGAGRGRDGGEVGAGLGLFGGVGQQDLETGVVAAQAGEHDGVAAADVLALDARLGGLRGGAQVVDDVCVALARGEHEGGLVVFVQGDAMGFVA